MKVSIVIRTKNEEKWIKQCLLAVKSQITNAELEIILVDNKSTDKTVQKALCVCPEIILVEIDDYLPGKALNLGFSASSGEYLVCLSAHCPPASSYWLESFLKHVDTPSVAGVYGRQIPTKASKPVDARDLLITFGLEEKIQKKILSFIMLIQ